MSVYSVKGRGWRYDFIRCGRRHTAAWFKTKREAMQAEAKRRETAAEEQNPRTQIDMGFLELVNRRLDQVKAYRSPRHYDDHRYLARRWVELWGGLTCSQVVQETVERFILERGQVSAQTANKELRYLRATFNFGKKKKWIHFDPTDGLESHTESHTEANPVEVEIDVSD